MDGAVVAFAFGVADSMAGVVEQVWQVAFEHLGDFGDGLESAADGPGVPTIEEIFGGRTVEVSPKPAELFLDGPGARGFEAAFLDGVEGAALLGGHIGF